MNDTNTTIGTYKNGEQCEPCPEGALCGNNTIIGNQAGWWTAGSINFYPCHRGTNPSPSDIEAAKEACPSANIIPTPCGEGYESARCLVCSSGYGSSGSFCRSKKSTCVKFLD